MKGLIGRKIGMTQVYDDKGTLIPVTVVNAGPCKVIGLKTKARDGYCAVQLGFGTRKANCVSKAVKGQIAKAGIENYIPECIREFRTDDDAQMEIGTDINAGIFAEGEFLDVTGITIVGQDEQPKEKEEEPAPQAQAPAYTPQQVEPEAPDADLPFSQSPGVRG